MKTLTALAALALLAAVPAHAGDPAAGEKEFAKCRACHMIQDGDNVIQRGGKTGPNLFGIIGRTAGTSADFNGYGDSLKEAGAKGLVWTEALIAEYVVDPKAFLEAQLGGKATSKMAFKLRKGGEDVAAYLASVGGGS